MKNKNDGGPAYPVTRQYLDRNKDGMSLRDYFAAKAMPIILGDILETQDIEIAKKVLTLVSLGAYEIADAMLKERDK